MPLDITITPLYRVGGHEPSALPGLMAAVPPRQGPARELPGRHACSPRHLRDGERRGAGAERRRYPSRKVRLDIQAEAVVAVPDEDLEGATRRGGSQHSQRAGLYRTRSRRFDR